MNEAKIVLLILISIAMIGILIFFVGILPWIKMLSDKNENHIEESNLLKIINCKAKPPVEPYLLHLCWFPLLINAKIEMYSKYIKITTDCSEFFISDFNKLSFYFDNFETIMEYDNGSIFKPKFLISDEQKNIIKKYIDLVSKYDNEEDIIKNFNL